jgi:phosphoenolpyruvate carboxylase
MTTENPIVPNQISTDIKLLGKLLGAVIREQHGQEAFEMVEGIRAIAKARRNGDPNATEQLILKIQNATLEQKAILTKAFSNYFQLINIAEDQERIRVLRERESQERLSETIDEALLHISTKGMSAKGIRALFEQLRLRFVLTAHPSEAKHFCHDGTARAR